MQRLLTSIAVAVLVLVSLAACRTPQEIAADRIPGWEAHLKDVAALADADLVPGASPLVDHYWQAGKETPVAIVPNVLAIRGPRSLVQRGKDFIPGVLGEVGDAHPALQRLTNEELYFVATTPQGSPEIDALLDAPPAGALVGRALLYPRPGADPLTWGASVLTRQVVGNVQPQVIAGLSDDQARAKVAKIVAPLGLDVTTDEIIGDDTFVFRVRDRDAHAWLRAAQRLRDDPVSAGIAHPDLILGIELHSPPDDPLLEEQWHLRNRAQFGGLAGADIDVGPAWEMTTGSASVVVAVVDAYRVDLTHPDLVGRVAPGSFDARSNSGFDGSELPREAHATWVAGVAVASTNEIGVCGVAPGCRFLSLALGLNPTEGDVALCIDRSIRFGCQVVNLSWGYREGNPGATDTVWRVVSWAVEKRSCVFVASVPNWVSDAGASTTRSFVQHPGVIAVGRSTDLDVWGPCGYGACVSVVAPSGYAPGTWDRGTECVAMTPGKPWGFRNIATTDARAGLAGNFTTGLACLCQPTEATDRLLELADLDYTRCFRGTSAAAPQVAGAAALILSIRPTLTPAQVRWSIESTARKIRAPLGVPVGPGSAMDFPYTDEPGTGLTRSRAVGHGCLDVGGAVRAAMRLR